MAKGSFISASSFKVIIDKKMLIKEAISAPKNRASSALAARQIVGQVIENAQNVMVEDFKNHAVTSEIKSGPSGSNSSGTLGGYGNLFSFIGFDNGQDPTQIIEEILSLKINFQVRSLNSGQFRITIFQPTSDKIFGSTPLPWASSSWAEGIEKGISNLGSYLYSSKGFRDSRSSTGIQSKNKAAGMTFKTTPYISKILQDFRKNIIDTIK